MKQEPTKGNPAKPVTRINRYTICEPKQYLRLPATAVRLSHVITAKGIDLYFLCDLTDPTEPGELRGYHLFKTGEDLPAWVWDKAVHVCSTPGLHLFEAGPLVA